MEKRKQWKRLKRKEGRVQSKKEERAGKGKKKS
jgi:hypothetical protein